ncbi:hypothetical protein NDU88_002265 [Pleurodeles waltl]|uniref:Uncharacterized protein n=1 Tax=Pleurodeles waltl TaxID=8319 RepID=A0AAV7T1Q8_PLEWA|nr:hypothetical protein NDU88_002265 [Pleurodeles waltl]
MSPRFSGLSKFSSGKTIVQVGDSAVKLDDGKWWNKDKISLTKSVATEKVKDGGSGEFVVRQESQLPFTSSAARYPKRVVGSPKKFDDYVVRSSHRPTKGKHVLGRVDGSCRCHGFRAMERAPGRMWNAGGLAVVEKGGCGRNG